MDKVIGFLGLGEAGQALGRDLSTAGATVVGYDITFDEPERGSYFREMVRDLGIQPVDEPDSLASRTETIVSTVNPSAAVDAARSISPRLSSAHLYVDLNSISPGTKEEVRRAVEEGEGRFVEGAIMGSVPKHGRHVPILLCGPDAAELGSRLAGWEMRLEILGDQFGRAAATKMCRSLVIKGLECLLAESLAAARSYDVTGRVLASLDETLSGIDWRDRADYALGRMALHARRRSHEMKEVARTVSDCGLDPDMSLAAVGWFERVAELALSDGLGDWTPDGFDDVLTAMDEASQR